MPKKTKKEREASDVEREMDDASGPLDDEDGDGHNEEVGEEDSPAPVELSPEEEQRAERVLATLRASEAPLTADKLHPEVNTEGSSDYVPAGQLAKVLSVLISRGLVEHDGEAWAAVRPGMLAMRRGELLATIINMDGDCYEVEPETDSDARALGRAGLVYLDESDDGFFVRPVNGLLQRVFVRGCIAEVETVMAECRPVGVVGLIVDGDPAAVLADERMKRERAEKDLEEVKGQRERLRGYLRERHVNPDPIENPAPAAQPVRAVEGDRRETWTKVVTLDDAGRAEMMRELLECYREDKHLEQRLESAKEAHAALVSGIKESRARIKERIADIDRENGSGKRTITREAVVRFDWGADEEVWLDAEDGKELERRPIRAGAQKPFAFSKTEAKPTPAAEQSAPAPEATSAPPGDAMRIVPAGASVGGEETPTAPAKPKAPALTKENVEDELVRIVGELPTETETLTTGQVADKVAERWGIEAGTSLGQLVKLAARKAYEKGLVRHTLEGGAERVSRMPEKSLDEAARLALHTIRMAGAEGVKLGDLAPATRAGAEQLLERGLVTKNGKKGAASRLVAKEHAPKGNGTAPAEV